MSGIEINPGQSPEETGYVLAGELRAEARTEANVRILDTKEPVDHLAVIRLAELASEIALRANQIIRPPLQ